MFREKWKGWEWWLQYFDFTICSGEAPSKPDPAMLNIILDKDSGEPRLPHRIDLSTGIYNNKKILIKKEKTDNTK